MRDEPAKCDQTLSEAEAKSAGDLENKMLDYPLSLDHSEGLFNKTASAKFSFTQVIVRQNPSSP